MILHFGNGQKGGVGKTFFIKMLIEYYLYKTWTYKLYDLDAGSLDVGRVYAPDIYAKKKKGDKTNDEYFLQFTDNKYNQDEVDEIFESALAQNVICNFPSNIKHLFNPWITDNGLIDLAKENNTKIVNWFVSNGEHSSIDEFIKCVNKFKNCETFQHIFVKNYGLEENWDRIIQQHKNLREILQADSIICFDLPAFSPTRYKIILDHNLTFAAAKDSKELNIVARQAVKKLLDLSFERFDRAFIALNISQQEVAH